MWHGSHSGVESQENFAVARDDAQLGPPENNVPLNQEFPEGYGAECHSGNRLSDLLTD